MQFIIRLIVNAIALYLVAYYMPGVSVSNWVGALVAALVLGVINAVLRPILIILTLPIQIVTLGLFTLVINAVLFYWVGHWGIGLYVSTFSAAFWGAIVLGIVSFLLSFLVGRVEEA